MTRKYNERGGSLVVVLILLLLVAGLAAGGFIVYKNKLQPHGPTKASLPHTSLTQEAIGFTYSVMPELYTSLFEINRQVSLIDMELSRLAALQSNYPQQERIIKTEKTLWEGTRRRLMKVMESFDNKIEAIYVAYSVNQEKGKQLMENETDGLQSAAKEVLEFAKVETARIHIEQPKTFMEKLKAKFSK